MKRYFFIIVFLFCATCYMLHATWINAVNMESSRYQIQAGNVNIGADEMISGGNKLSITLGQLAAGEFNRNGYVIKAGFQYLHSIIPFTFSISNTNINLGILKANTPAISNDTKLTVSFGGAGQYLVTAIKKTPLQTMSGGEAIPDTTCDGGTNTCTSGAAKPWTSNTAYGFGYSMVGADIPTDFINTNYFRPFNEESAGEDPVAVMTNVNVTKNPSSSPQNRKQSSITFKVNVSPNQAGGSYQTVIHFVAIPSF